MRRFTVRLSDAQTRVVEELRRLSVRRDDVPELSEAAVVRELLDLGLRGETAGLGDYADELADAAEEADADEDELGDVLLDLVPEHVRVEHERERIKDENRLRDLRAGFEGRVSQQLRRRFENGYDPEGLAAVAEGYRAEARLLWATDEERRQRAVDHIDDELRKAVEAAETTDHDPTETDYSSYAGVERAETLDRLANGELREEAERLLSTAERGERRSSSEAHAPEEVVSMLSARKDVTEEAAREAVEAVAGRRADGRTAAADGGEER